MSTQPTPQPDIITQMVRDPDFVKMAPSEQRKALAAHDPIFGKAGDDAIGQFVQAHQAPAQTPAPPAWQAPKAADYLHAFGLPANMQEAKQMQVASQQRYQSQSFGQNLKDTLAQSPLSDWKTYVLGPGGGIIGSMGKELVRAVKNPQDPMSGVHAASAINPFAAPIVDQMTTLREQGQQGPADAAGIVGATTLALPFLKNLKGVAGRGLLLGKTPEGAYESAMKPSTVMPPAQRAKIVQTGLQEGIPVSKGGLEKISTLIDQVNAEISNKIAADPTRPISTQPAIQNLQGTKQRFATQVNPRADLQAINEAGKEFGQTFGSQMPAEQAQAVKQGTYRALGDKAYGELKGASIEAQKALARGLKEELANQFPELNDLNARDSRLIDLQTALERSVGRISNHQIMGIGTPIVGSAAKAVTGSNKLAGVAAVMKAVLDNPNVKSRLAIALSRGKTSPMMQVPRIAAYGAALGSSSRPQSLPFLPGSSGNSSQSPNQ